MRRCMYRNQRCNAGVLSLSNSLSSWHLLHRHEIVEGDSPLWTGVSEPYKHTVRSFLVHFHFQLLREASTSARVMIIPQLLCSLAGTRFVLCCTGMSS